MKNLKEKLSKLSVLVFGDMCLDKDYIGEYSGQSKENKDLSIFRTFRERHSPGGGGNLAACFASLGVKTSVIGIWGSDDNMRAMNSEFVGRGINSLDMVRSGETNVFGKFYLNNGVHIFRYDVVSDGMNDRVEEELSRLIRIKLPSVDFVACADYSEAGVRDVCSKKLLRVITEHKLPKFATGRKDVSKFRNFNCLLLNDSEFKKFLESSEVNTGMELIKDLFLEELVITTKDGATFFSKDGKGIAVAEKLKGKIDTCGCGDMFYATYASCKMAGYDVVASLKLANCAAGIVAKKMFGADQATIDEIFEKL